MAHLKNYQHVSLEKIRDVIYKVRRHSKLQREQISSVHLGRSGILKILSLSVYKSFTFLHLFPSSWLSLSKFLCFSVQRIYTSFVEFILIIFFLSFELSSKPKKLDNLD